MKVGQDAAKQALKSALAPSEAPSHATAPETRQAMSAQRAGERADLGSLPFGWDSPAIRAAQLQEMNRLENSFDQLTPSGSATVLPAQSGGLGAAAPGATGGMGAGLEFNPSIGGTLGAAGGAYGLGRGIANKNPLQAAGGGASTLGSLAGMAGMPALGAGLGAIGGPLSLAQGIKTGDPLQIGTGALGTYNSLATLSQLAPELSNSLIGTTLPSTGQLASQGLNYAAPQLANALGVGSTGATAAGLGGSFAGAEAAGAAAPALADAAMGGTVAGLSTGAGAGAGTGAGMGVGAGLGATVGVAALPAMILAGIFAKKDADEMRGLINRSKESVRMQNEMPGVLSRINQAYIDPNTINSTSTEDLLAKLQQMNNALDTESGQLEHFITMKGSEAPSRIKRVDTAEQEAAKKQMAEQMAPEAAAVQDELARRGVPLDQFFRPGTFTDILGLAGGGTWNAADPSQLAKIGPGNMAQAIDMLRSGQSLESLGPSAAGVDAMRRAAMQGQWSGPNYVGDLGVTHPLIDPYFFNAQDRQAINDYDLAYRSWQGNMGGAGQTEGAPSVTYFGQEDPRVAALQRSMSVPTFAGGGLQPSTFGQTGGMTAGMPNMSGAISSGPATTGAIDPGVAAAGAGKRSPTFLTPELDNRAEAGAGKVGGQPGAAGDQGVPFGVAGKRGGMGIAPQPRPGGGRPGGQAPFGGVPRSGLMPQANGGRPQPNPQRTAGVV